jgi:2-iminobutanoate/2-iminopropanoate deaminase
MKPRIIHTKAVPPGRARISQAVAFGNLVFVSGVVARDPSTGKTVTGGVAAQTRQVLEAIQAILQSAGTTLENVLKTDCYLQDMDQFDAFNRVWEDFFPVNPPARICVQAGRLGPGFEVEITAVAAMPSSQD